MWLLNHTTLRQFELEQLQRFGITEVFLPKSFPYDEGNLSASVDSSMDASLTIPPEDLALLNAQNWYETPSDEAWQVANKHFDIVVIAFFMNQVKAATTHFDGAIMLHVFGLSKGYSYTKVLIQELGPQILDRIRGLRGRFWFAVGYEHLPEVEGDILRRQSCFLPIGLSDATLKNAWTGTEKKIFFVCPRIGSSPYFNEIYRNFCTNFAGFDYLIGGAQPVAVNDPKVLGFVPLDVHESNMRSCAVMYYHSQEPNHIHYHPFEAIRCGMPLVFMAEGMLDRLGGSALPGRCQTIEEARQKIKRIIDGDQAFIESIRQSQTVLLEGMHPDRCQVFWQKALENIMVELQGERVRKLLRTKSAPKKIAIIVPVGYRGGSLRGAKLLAEALLSGSKQAGEEAEIVFGYLDDPDYDYELDFLDLSPEIQCRPYVWRTLSRAESKRAMLYSGVPDWQPEDDFYLVADDGMKQFCDCDLWVIVSDRVLNPLLPIRPYVAMIYDYIQRHLPALAQTNDIPFLKMVRAAERVLVTTKFTEEDALNYAVVERKKLFKVPMLAPRFKRVEAPVGGEEKDTTGSRGCFIWTTNAAPHKNHVNTLLALQDYYETMDGQLDCIVTGVGTASLLKNTLPHLASLPTLVARSEALRRHIQWAGELPDAQYQRKLAGAAFLLHSACIDNGTFSVIEASCLGTPSLSSKYPAMEEIDSTFNLGLVWMNPRDPHDMARQLKWMEQNAKDLRTRLPEPSSFDGLSVEKLAPAYWNVVRKCL